MLLDHNAVAYVRTNVGAFADDLRGEERRKDAVSVTLGTDRPVVLDLHEHRVVLARGADSDAPAPLG